MRTHRTPRATAVVTRSTPRAPERAPARVALSANRALLRQVAVSEPGDALEREADRVADDVLRMPEPVVQRACGCGGSCGPCAARVNDEVARTAAAAPQTHDAPSLGTGRALDAETRAFFEPRLGADLSHVRVHTGDDASASAHNYGALAYTYGSDVVFGAGQFAPNTASGKRLIAHELVHAVQQSPAGESEEANDGV